MCSVDKLLDIELAIATHHYLLDSEHRLVEQERKLQSDRMVAMQTLSAGIAQRYAIR